MTKYAYLSGYSDADPFEVIREVSAKTLIVRPMKAELLNGVGSGQPDALHFSPGGFCGHTSGTQRWDIQPDESAKERRIRLQRNGKWRDADGNPFVFTDRPYKYYDFNF